MLDIDFENIPESLKGVNQWVGFTINFEGKKMPIDIKTGKAASISDNSTWASFDEVRNAVAEDKCPMIGFALQEHNHLVFIDLDCHADRCSSDESRQELIAKYDALVKETSTICTYAEKSVSGEGIHLIANCMLDPVYKAGGSHFNSCLEIYNSKRFVIFTGHKLNDFPISNSLDVQEQIFNLQRKYFLNNGDFNSKVSQDYLPILLTQIRTDDEVLKIAMRNEEFKLLWEGKWQHIEVDGAPKYEFQHFADFRLIRYLTFYTGNFPEQVKRLFKKSPCYHEYGKNGKYNKYESDINNDIKTCSQTCTAVYDTKYASKVNNNLEPVIHTINYDKFTQELNGAYNNGKKLVQNIKLFNYLTNYVFTYKNANIKYLPDIFKRLNNINDYTHFVLSMLGGSLLFSQRYNEFFLFNGKKYVLCNNKDALINPILETLSLIKHSVFAWFANEAIFYINSDVEKMAMNYFETADRIVTVKTASDILTNIKGIYFNYDVLTYYETPYLNCQNGALDIAKRELAPHSSTQRLYKITNCDYDPTAICPVFENMLKTLLPDDSIRHEFQKAVGLCLAKKQLPAKKIFCVLLGDANTGKTTTLNILRDTLGDYAASIDNSLLIKSNSDKTRGPEMYDMMDSLFISSSELDTQQSLDASKVKQITGSTQISFRNNYAINMTKFTMIGLLFVDTNQRPYFDDDAVFSRLKVFPFKQVIKEKDPMLGEKLNAEKSGILNWILAGLDMVLEEGEVHETNEMLAEKKTYKDNMSIVTQFTQDCLLSVPFPGYKIVTSVVYNTFLNWSKQNNFKPLSRPLFYEELEKTFQKKKSNKEYFIDIAFSPIGDLYSKMQEMLPKDFARELKKLREMEDENDYLLKREAYFKSAWPFFVKNANFGSSNKMPDFTDYIGFCATWDIGCLMEDDYRAKIHYIISEYMNKNEKLKDADFADICKEWYVTDKKIKRIKEKYPKTMIDNNEHKSFEEDS